MHCNYHTHTYRCRHAYGTEREYIEAAISVGITKLGFSDHVPFIFPDGHESTYRVKTSEVGEYIETAKKLKEEYRGKLDLYLGFEMEFYPPYFDKMLADVKRWGAEFLILGQHYIGCEHPNGTACTRPNDREEDLCEYTRDVISAINTGMFTYVAHPDVFNFTGCDDIYIREMRKLCQAAKAGDIPLEINFLGIRDERFYPRDLFWKIAGEIGNDVVYGFDAHDVAGACDMASKVYADDMVEKFGLRLLDEPKLVRIDK